MSIKEQVAKKLEKMIQTQQEALNGWYKEFYIANKEQDSVLDLAQRIHETEIRLDTLKEVQKEIYCTLGIWNEDV